MADFEMQPGRIVHDYINQREHHMECFPRMFARLEAAFSEPPPAPESFCVECNGPAYGHTLCSKCDPPSDCWPPIAPEAVAALSAGLADFYDNPGHDATPEYCALCEQYFTLDDGPIPTTWGQMHRACLESHDDALGYDDEEVLP